MKQLKIQVDNPSTILDKIGRLYSEKNLSDVCLLVGGKEFLAHRLILCASSEVFQVKKIVKSLVFKKNFIIFHSLSSINIFKLLHVFVSYTTELSSGKIKLVTHDHYGITHFL